MGSGFLGRGGGTRMVSGGREGGKPAGGGITAEGSAAEDGDVAGGSWAVGGGAGTEGGTMAGPDEGARGGDVAGAGAGTEDGDMMGAGEGMVGGAAAGCVVAFDAVKQWVTMPLSVTVGAHPLPQPLVSTRHHLRHPRRRSRCSEPTPGCRKTSLPRLEGLVAFDVVSRTRARSLGTLEGELGH